MNKSRFIALVVIVVASCATKQEPETSSGTVVRLSTPATASSTRGSSAGSPAVEIIPGDRSTSVNPNDLAVVIDPGVLQLTAADLAWYSKRITVRDASGAVVPTTTISTLPSGPDPYARIAVQVVGGIATKSWYELSLDSVATGHRFRSTPNHRINMDGSRSVRFTTDTTAVIRRVQLCEKGAGVLGGSIVYSERLPTASWGHFTVSAGTSACTIVGLPTPTVGADGKVLSGAFAMAEIRCSGDMTAHMSVQSDAAALALDGTPLGVRSHVFDGAAADLLDDGCRYWRP